MGRFGPDCSLCVLMYRYGFIKVSMCPYRSLCVIIVAYASLWVIIGPFAFLCVLMGHDGSL